MGELYPIWNIDSQIYRSRNGMERRGGGIFATAFQPSAEMSGLWMAIPFCARQFAHLTLGNFLSKPMAWEWYLLRNGRHSNSGNQSSLVLPTCHLAPYKAGKFGAVWALDCSNRNSHTRHVSNITPYSWSECLWLGTQIVIQSENVAAGI